MVLSGITSSAAIGPRTLVCLPDGDPGRHFGLVVPLLATGVLPRRDEARGVPRLLRRALRHRRAEHDRLPAAGRRSVPPLGRGGAGGLSLRAETRAAAARRRADLRRAR